MNVLKTSIVAAGLVGGAAMLAIASPASAASLAPALAPTGGHAAIQTITHDPLARPGAYYGNQYYGQRYYGQRNYSRYGYSRPFRRSAPAVGFGLSVPGFSFGIGTPSYYGYGGYGGYGTPYGYGYHRYR
jgi:hypothetical protein